MARYSITLKQVYSAPAEDIPAEITLPQDWRLSWHQLETWKAINDLSIDVIFNTALTGDGKSLGAYLKSLLTYYQVMGLYPTNELARDQQSQIQDYIEAFAPPHEPRVNRLNSAELELYAEREDLSKAIAIDTRGYQSEILLTNPDMFHYLHRGAYLSRFDNPDKLWNRIDKYFKLLVFDEFHVFNAPQIAGVINTLLLIRRTNRPPRYLFLSATPDEELINRLGLAGFNIRWINPVREGKYKFPDSPKEAEELRVKGWRLISRQVNLSFIPLESSFGVSETWLKENKELILSYFQTYPHSKGAIILNSIASVKRLVPLFRELFAAHGLTVGENTGLSGSRDKLNSLGCDLVLGTSTIDVGVDFKINFLVFESGDAGNFIQRLGRLGRHDGYDGHEFERFTAYALVPKFLVERLFDKDNAPLEERGKYDRISLTAAITHNYRRINNFSGYYKRWGAVQSFRLYYDLGKPQIKEQYHESRQKFRQDCEKVFDTGFNRVTASVMRWAEEWKELSAKVGNPIFNDAVSFRGSSSLLCGLYDPTEDKESDRFKTYDLPGILSNLEVEMWTEAAFMRQIKGAGETIPKARFKPCLAFMKLRGYNPERLNWRFTYRGDLRAIADAWKVQVLVGVEVWQPDNVWINGINRHLRVLGLVSYVLARPVAEVRQRLQLPMGFQIYPISDETSIHDRTSPYSIAIGQSALLLDTLAYRFKDKGGKAWIC
ncbi:MAG: hypothetical protein N5P05_002259 [Chroococcopsis gigantea SAG 12.99]|jgi:CRISPR-associated endonuclease/helicase Cas3|nr:hypothetical protein [Chroococcopsis gigantea SAG 12.99]